VSGPRLFSYVTSHVTSMVPAPLTDTKRAVLVWPENCTLLRLRGHRKDSLHLMLLWAVVPYGAGGFSSARAIFARFALPLWTLSINEYMVIVWFDIFAIRWISQQCERPLTAALAFRSKNVSSAMMRFVQAVCHRLAAFNRIALKNCFRWYQPLFRSVIQQTHTKTKQTYVMQ